MIRKPERVGTLAQLVVQKPAMVTLTLIISLNVLYGSDKRVTSIINRQVGGSDPSGRRKFPVAQLVRAVKFLS
jgi:hypothetical protein